MATIGVDLECGDCIDSIRVEGVIDSEGKIVVTKSAYAELGWYFDGDEILCAECSNNEDSDLDEDDE